MNRLKKYKAALIVTVFAVLVWVFAIVQIQQATRTRQDDFLAGDYHQLEAEIAVTIDSYQAFSEYLFYSLIDETVLAYMHQAQEESTREQAREGLFDYLENAYQQMVRYDFKQFHFQLPSGDSFLRFHQKETYGDNMFSTRETIRIANEELTKASGFEAGRIYHGYRFVYPIIDETTHLGSVEISISVYTLLEMLYSMYTDADAFFVMKDTTVDDQIFEDLLDNFSETPLAEGYYRDRLVEADFLDLRRHFSSHDLDDFFSYVGARINSRMHQHESFSYAFMYEGTPFVMHFYAISNLLDEHVGYIITVNENDQFFLIRNQSNLTIFIITLFFAFIIVTTVIFFTEREKLRYLSRHDSLTQLYNRRAFMEIVTLEYERAVRYDKAFSVMLFDIDHFKKINDTYGHMRGDKILKELTTCVKETLRQTDVIARWGGEEFIVLLPEAGSDKALIVGNKLRRAVEAYRFSHAITLTVSVGVSSFLARDLSVSQIISRSDKALYEAKNSGRNQVKSL